MHVSEAEEKPQAESSPSLESNTLKPQIGEVMQVGPSKRGDDGAFKQWSSNRQQRFCTLSTLELM
jgi:hypothetical protein